MLYIQVSIKGVVGHAIPTWGLPVGHYLHSYKEVHQLEVTFCAPAGPMADRLAKYFVPMFGQEQIRVDIIIIPRLATYRINQCTK